MQDDDIDVGSEEVRVKQEEQESEPEPGYSHEMLSRLGYPPAAAAFQSKLFNNSAALHCKNNF